MGKEKPQILIIYVVEVFVVNHESLSWKTKISWKRMFITFMLDIHSKINSFYLFLISTETDYFLLFVILNIFYPHWKKWVVSLNAIKSGQEKNIKIFNFVFMKKDFWIYYFDMSFVYVEILFWYTSIYSLKIMLYNKWMKKSTLDSQRKWCWRFSVMSVRQWPGYIIVRLLSFIEI